jgi:Fe-S-cluster-containing hydrogenase component 2
MKGNLFVACDPDKCVGCNICEYACSFKKEGVFNPTKSRIRAIRVNSLINMAIACRKCEDAPCVIACPKEGVLVQRLWDGLITVNEEECNGCGWCIEACDFGAITLHPEKKVAMVCDLCGGEPECVKWCPEEALQLTTRNVLAQKARVNAVEKLLLNTRR